jgi:hypothetical protein
LLSKQVFFIKFIAQVGMGQNLNADAHIQGTVQTSLHNASKELREICIEKRCIKQPVLTAAKNAMSHSSQTAQGQFTAENATQNEDHHADTKHSYWLVFYLPLLFSKCFAAS